MSRELDERQEMLHRIDTHQPLKDIAPAPAANRARRRTRWQRFVLRLKAIVLRRA